MKKLPPVEEAKALMRDAAADWSMWQWLTGKHRLRTAADAAWAALEGQERKIKSTWSEELRQAYRSKNGQDLDPRSHAALQRMRDADHAWRQARTTAEATFDEAERRMSTSLARQGAAQAIEAWELTERAIRRAEALVARSYDCAE